MLVLVILHQTGSLHDSGILTCPFFFLWRRKFKSFNEISIEDLHSSWCQCLTLRPLDCSLPGSSVHGIFQVRILEWVGIPFSRGSSQPRDGSRVSYISGRFFTRWTTREAQLVLELLPNKRRFLPLQRSEFSGKGQSFKKKEHLLKTGCDKYYDK